ncbi:Early nodulin-like protein 2 [Vitis vinifera]|uniref:Early nodulin-like protein 2 n=1 Tax=Vitis vinifera TaxID=29760 RepID=A0A438EGN4_VITVI|nr:Early nodulin-like protein 2 [Vitis vinifera]
MEFLKRSLLLLAIFMAFLCSSQGYVFYVGGKQGWSENPSEDYIQWAERNRFQVNDTLVDDYEWRRFAVFKYEKGQNSVLVVNREDYYKCNVENPINKYTDGNTEFKLDRSGSFFFIGGNADYCQKGQRLIVVVLAVRNESQTPTPTPSVPGNPPLLSPPSESPEGSPSPASSPAGDEHSPAPAPHGSAPGLTRPVVWVLGVGFGVSVVLGNFVGLYI